MSRQFLTKLRSNLFIPRHLSVHGKSVCKPTRLWLAVKIIEELSRGFDFANAKSKTKKMELR